MRKIYLLFSLLILIVGCQKEPSVQNEEKEEWNGIEPKFRITTLEPEELKKELKIIEILPSFKNGSNFQENKGQVAILYDSINNIYINTKEVKKMESSNGKYHSYTFHILNPRNKANIENLFFSLQPDGTYKVFRVIYSFDKNDIDNIRNGKFVELKGKTQIIEIRKGFNIPQLLEKSSFPPTCAIVTVTYCSGSQNHPGGYNPDGSNCPAHEEYSAEFCTGGDGGGGGTQSWPTYDTGTGGTGGGGEPTDPGDGTCIADTDGNCIDDTTTVTLPPPGSVEEIFPDLFFETLGENNLQYWWTVDASDAFKIEVMNYLINEGYTAEAESFALAACFAKKAGGEVDFENHLENYDFHAETAEILIFEQDYRAGMSSSEKAIFDSLSRFQQLDYLHSGFLAKKYAEIYYESQTLYNGIGDAYRHALWNAIATVKLGETLTERLASAHEDRTPVYSYEYKEVQMDLFNNNAGRGIGKQSSLMLMMKVKFGLEKGELKYLSNTNPRATSNSALIPTNQ